MSGPGSQGRRTLQPLQPPDPEQWLMMVRPPCCPKLGLLSSANSARARDAASDAIVSSTGTRSSSNSARRATSSAKSRSEKECGPKDTPVEPVSTVLSSNQSTPVAKESGGELQFQSWTRNSQIAMHGHSWQSCCIEPWSNWLSCLESQAWLTVTKAKIGWVNQKIQKKMFKQSKTINST